MRFAIMKSRADAAPGLSGLRIMHLQQIIRTAGSESVDRLLKLLAWLGTAAYAEHDYFPEAFWQLHMAARLSAVGVKARPIACGDTIRRIIGAIFCRTHKRKLAALFEGVHQYGVGTCNGVERLATAAQLVHQAGGVVLALDGRNAFNATSRRAIFREAAKHVPDLYPYLTRMYGPEVFASLVFAMDGKAEAAILPSQQGVQQGDNLGPMLFALALLPLMQSFKAAFPEVSLPGYLDDLTLLCHSGGGLATDLALLRPAFAWIKDHLAEIGVEINLDKTYCLLPAGAVAPAGEDREVADWASAELGGVLVTREGGLKLAGVPVGSPAYVQRTTTQLLRVAEADSLVAELAGCRDTQLAFTLLRMCYLPPATFLTRNVGLPDVLPELARFDAMVMGAFAAVMQEPLVVDHDAETGVESEWDMFVEQVSAPGWTGVLPVALTPLQQRQVRLRQSLGGIGLPSHVNRCHAAFVGRMVYSLPLAYTALPDSIRKGLRPSLLALPLMTQTRGALLALRTAGVTVEQLTSVLPPHWATWALAENDSAEATQAGESLLDDLDDVAPDASIQKVQAKLCRFLDVADVDLLQAGLADAANHSNDETRCQIAQARFRSQRGKGAMSYLSAAPSCAPHLSLKPEDMREAVRRGLGRNLPPPGGLCNIDSCARKGVAMSAEHLYAGTSCNNGEQNTRHHALRDVLYYLLRTMCKVPCRKEDNTPFAAAGHGELFMDCVATGGHMKVPAPMDECGTLLTNDPTNPGFGHDSKHLMADASLTNNRTTKFRRSLAGTAAKFRTKEKIIHYGGKFDPSSYSLLPFVSEFDGTLCAPAHALIRAAALHQSSSSDGAWLQSDCVRLWRQSVSISVQTSISQTVLRSMLRTRRITGQPPPDCLAYRRVRLLCPTQADLPATPRARCRHSTSHKIVCMFV